MTFPDLIVSRNGSTVTVRAMNRGGKPMRVWRSGEYSEEAELLDDVDEDVYIDSGVVGDAAYLIQYGELEFSIEVVENYPDAVPPYMVIAAVGDTQLTATSHERQFSWEDHPIQILTTRIDPLSYGMKSVRKYTRQP